MDVADINKKVFEYLFNNSTIAQKAVVAVEHPVAGGDVSKGRIVVTPLRDANLGKYQSLTPAVEIQITCYHQESIRLFAPAPDGLHALVSQEMTSFADSQHKPNFEKIREYPPVYASSIDLYMMVQVWRFYPNA
jgi:hypothetical protein